MPNFLVGVPSIFIVRQLLGDPAIFVSKTEMSAPSKVDRNRRITRIEKVD